jgi:Flp pilus assembly protein TadB
LDQQLGDMVWSITTGLHAAYNLVQVFEAISKEAPEPASSAAKQFLDEIGHGSDEKTALNRMRQAFPSPYMDRLVNAILEFQKTGVNLGDALEPLSEEFLSECGTDPAFYEFMREEARQLGAMVPERAKLRE